MSLLDSFIHGDALTQILIEGHNPYARQKLDTAAADALRQHVHAPDSLLAYVCGREVMSGTGVFAVTEGKLLVYRSATHGVTPFALAQISQVEAVLGKYGHTVRVHAQGRTYALYGTDKSLAQALHEALVAKGVASTFEDKAPRGTLWAAYSGPQPTAENCLADARQRLLAA
jgi:hypothetical protein